MLRTRSRRPVGKAVPSRRPFRIAALLLVAASMAACGGGGDSGTPTNPPPTTPTFPAPLAGEGRTEVGLALPAGFGLPPGSMEVFAGTQPAELDASGRGRTNLPSGQASVVGLSSRSSGQPVALSLNVGATPTQELSARSTAEALVLLSPTLATATSAQATQLLTAVRSSPALTTLTTAVESRMRANPEQALATADPTIITAVRTVVGDALRAAPSPRFDEPARALPTTETPTDRGGIQLTTVPERDAQGRLQVRLDNGQPRWVSVVRSYSDDGITWTTPTAENGTFGVMLGAGTRAGQSLQPPTATIPLSPAPYTRLTTYGIGSNIAAVESDPNGRYAFAAAAAQALATVAVPSLEPVLASTALRTGLRWGTSDAGVLQQWVVAMLPCLQSPTILAAIQRGVQTQNLDEAFGLVHQCAMQAGGNNAAILTGLLQSAGLTGRTAPAALGKMFGVLGNLSTAVQSGAFNTTAISAVRAVNTFEVPDSSRFLRATAVSPSTGPIAGGTTITVTGGNFPATGVSVFVGGTAATSVQVTSSTQLTAVVPARATGGAVDVEVRASGYRTARCSGCFTYQAAQPPIVRTVTQPFGQIAGDQQVTIAGENFVAGMTVSFGGRAATSVQVVSATQITARTPSASAIGAVDVVVTPPGGAPVTCSNCFVYFSPTVRFSPESGPLTGGTVVTVTDIPSPSILTGVTVAGRPATGISAASATSVRFTAPAGTAAGDVDVVFRYPVGDLPCPGCWTYTGASSATGRFAGSVRDAVTNQPISGASVSIRTAGSSTEVARVTTGADGTYRTGELPAGTYDLHHSASGYSNSPLFGRVLNTGTGVPDTQLPAVLMVPSSATGGRLDGVVRDATTNEAIAGATVEIRSGGNNTTGTPLATVTSGTSGAYSFPSLGAGTYTVRATKTGFTEGSVIATVTQATQTAPVLFMSPVGSNFVWRIVLSWGANPSDLDSHLTGPQSGSTSRFHVYYSSKGSLTASPFARLDVDVTSGFGPETITIAQQIPGIYRYYIKRFSGSGSIATSGARVNLYRGNNLVQQFFPPQTSGDFWTVFELDGENVRVVNTIGSTEPSLRAPWDGTLRARRERAEDLARVQADSQVRK